MIMLQGMDKKKEEEEDLLSHVHIKSIFSYC